MTTTIYALEDSSGSHQKVYVGKTVKAPAVRLKEHVGRAKRGAVSPRDNWIRSLLDRGMQVSIVVLEEVDDRGDWEEAERFWIASFRAMGMPLLNLTDGGEGTAGIRRSDETRRRIGDAQRGRKLSPERCKRMSEAFRGRPPPAEALRKAIGVLRGRTVPAEQRRKISAALHGQKHSTERCLKNRLGHLGKTHSPETRQRMSDTHRGRPIPKQWGKELSESHRLKLVEGCRRWWAKQRALKETENANQLDRIVSDDGS
jgi:hypothetical protein